MFYLMTTYTFNYFNYLQLPSAAIDTKCAPPYACQTVDYLEETKLFTIELPKYWNESQCRLIMELLKHYMDDSFIFWPLKLKFLNFKT